MDKTKTNKNTELVKLEEEECYLICGLLDYVRQKANAQRLHKIQMICKELVDYVSDNFENLDAGHVDRTISQLTGFNTFKYNDLVLAVNMIIRRILVDKMRTQILGKPVFDINKGVNKDD